MFEPGSSSERSTQEQRASLRAAEPPFADAQAAPRVGELDAYAHFYGIDLDGQGECISHHVGVVESGPFRLSTQLWRHRTPRATVLLVHGYFDHSAMYGHLIRHALSRGCNVLTFDLPGHGLSSGDPVVIDDFAQYRQAVSDVLAAGSNLKQPWLGMAQSTGGAALIELAATGDWPFQRCVMLAPLVRPLGWRSIRLAYLMARPFRQTVRRSFNINSHDEVFMAFQREDPLQSQVVSVAWIGALSRWLRRLGTEPLSDASLLVLQGDEDGTVDGPYNITRIQQWFPRADVQWLPGAYHQLANESESIRADYTARIDRYLWSAADNSAV